MEMTMNKEFLKKILDKYIEAENEVSELDKQFGIEIWNSGKENFYNKFNRVIFDMFEYAFGPINKELIEMAIFEQNMTFDELWQAITENGYK